MSILAVDYICHWWSLTGSLISRWEATSSECSNSCGVGVKNVQYQCVQRYIKTQQTNPVDPTYCSNIRKPSTQEKCHGPCPDATWSYSDWEPVNYNQPELPFILYRLWENMIVLILINFFVSLLVSLFLSLSHMSRKFMCWGNTSVLCYVPNRNGLYTCYISPVISIHVIRVCVRPFYVFCFEKK